MPRLNANGDWCAGVGGGVVTVNGQVVAENAGGACWLDDYHVIYQHGSHLDTIDSRNGAFDDYVDEEGATDLAAGGGVYAAYLADARREVRISNRPDRVVGYLGDVGPDGTVLLKTPDGLFQGQYVKDLQSLGGASWSGLDASYRPVQSPDLSVPQVIPGRIYGFRRKGPYCCYQAEDGARVIVQYVDRPVGKVIAVTQNAFRPDLTILRDGRVRVIYAENEGESPDSIRIFDTHPLTWAALDAEPAPPVDPPDPPSDPEEPPTVSLHDELMPILEAVNADPAFALRIVDGSAEATSARSIRFLSEVVRRAHAKGLTRVGLLRKPSGINADNLTERTPSGTILHYDVISGGDGVNNDGTVTWQPRLSWGENGPIQSGWSQAFPEDVNDPPDTPDDPPDDPPATGDVLPLILAELRKLNQHLGVR